MNPLERWSLVALWWGTALVSALGWGGISHALVSDAGLVPAAWVSPLVAEGIALDVAMGAWLVWRPGEMACRAGIVVVLGFTALATLLVPGAWLHPFGPLLKNLPILALMARGSGWWGMDAREGVR
ncbi:DoxX-like family protein [Hydrogenophaga sp. MI9]|uniref:DoxX-like family protein n=1 Tax=Hydrogenophaga sp. MI9 TaxID=3453719 RepID=UPI003EEC8341